MPNSNPGLMIDLSKRKQHPDLGYRIGLLLACLLFTGGKAADWPQFLGPERNGSTTERITSWPSTGPRRIWKESVGSGYSGPIIQGTQVIVFDREGDQERVRCLDLASGRTRWSHQSPTAYVDGFGFDDGPRSTPAATTNQVITFGAEGRLTCLHLADGKKVWSVEAGRDLGADKGFFGPACSPLIVGTRIFLNLGNREGGGVAAFDLASGKLLWKATDHEAGYASPVPVPGLQDIAFFTREGLVLTRADGKVGPIHRWRSRQHASVNAASPLIHGSEIFLTTSYDTGAVLLRRTEDRVDVVWSGDESISAHYATPVLHRGFLYGFHGRQERGPEFRCVAWATGKVRWSEPSLGAGTVLLAGEDLVLLLESGELVVADASPDRIQIRSRIQILGKGTRAPFALGAGRLVARDPRVLVCLGE
jgi:outer membrane protein assembly factor BamB